MILVLAVYIRALKVIVEEYRCQLNGHQILNKPLSIPIESNTIALEGFQSLPSKSVDVAKKEARLQACHIRMNKSNNILVHISQVLQACQLALN